jgi:hypothetical protein
MNWTSTLCGVARMSVPELVCKVPYASESAWFGRVDGSLRSEQHNQQAELLLERDLGQSYEVVLSQACEVLESAGDSFHRDRAR